MRRCRLADWAAAAAVGGAAVAFVLGVFWRGAVERLTTPSAEYGGVFYPNLRYALDSLREGHGLLWNRFQNCGQPFFADVANGLLYPLHLVFLLVGPDSGQFVAIGLHLAVAGLGMYWLGRTLGLGRGAALVAALAFELSGPTIQLTGGAPTAAAAYVWMPAVLAASERLLRRPRGGAAVRLAVLLTVQLLAGHAQISAFTYQLVLFRFLWELAVRPELRRWRTAVVGVAGLALPLALGAAQFLPALEFAHESVLRGRLSLDELRPIGQALSWDGLRAALGERTADGNAVAVVTFALAGIGVAGAAPRSAARSYAAFGVLAVALAFDNAVFALYRLLPFVSSFPLPHHWLWVAGAAACLLAGFGAEALAQAGAAVARAAVVEGALAAVLLFAALSPSWLPAAEIGLLAALALVIALAGWLPAARPVVPLAALALVVAGSVLVSGSPRYGPPRDAGPLFAQRHAFEWLRQHMTPLERLYQFGAGDSPGFLAKSASLFRLPSITDDQPRTSERYATLMAYLFTNRRLQSVNDYYYPSDARPANRALFDLLATRYVVTDQPRVFAADSLPPFKEVAAFGTTSIFENPAALPRAFFVRQQSGVGTAWDALKWFATGLNNPRRFVMVDEMPPELFGGFPGTTGAGTVTVLDDLGEELALRVRAPWDGFLVVTDQYYPGWQATVNGVAWPLFRADYAFRAIKVPVGESTVVFRYRPASVRIGCIVSAATLAILAVTGLVAALRRRGAAAGARP